MTFSLTWLEPPPALEIERDHVHLFLAPTDVPLESFEVLTALLTPAERDQFEKFRMPQKRVEATLSRAMLRERLAHALRIPAPDVPLAWNSHGKPFLPQRDLHFNISHTAGFVLLAISRGHELGVDIESPRPAMDHEQLAKRFFTPGEHAALLAAAEDNRVNAFFRCWTRKEAVLKAMGKGIAGGLDTFEVPLHPAFAPLPVAGFMVHDLPVPKTHIAALATACPGATLHFWTWRTPSLPPLNDAVK